MSISVNGQSVVPPGFRFHPTEEELLTYYLKKKVASERIDLDVIRDVDLNKLEPWDIQEKCRIGSGPQNDWYLFSQKDKKYPTGTRTNRATAAGFWKATGRDKAIYDSSTRRIGMRKTLVFYSGRAPHGQKSDWIMHEYRLDDNVVVRSAAAAGDPYHPSPPPPPLAKRGGAAGDQQAAQEEGWVICRMFKKKNLVHHAQQSSANAITTVTSHTAAAAPSSSKMAVAATMESSCSSVTGVVRNHVKARKILHADSMSRRGPSCVSRNKQQDAKPAPQLDHRHHLAATTTTAAPAPATTTARPPSSVIYRRFMKLPPLEHVGAGSLLLPNLAAAPEHAAADASGVVADYWGCSLDRLAAYDGLNDLSDGASKNTSFCFDDPSVDVDGDLLWSLARSVSSSFHADLTMNHV